jgi:lincosamide nucleotidyltransferase A/C/D/E
MPDSMMTAGGLLAILDRLDSGAIELWLDGGWGVDALLGEQTRPHDDVDLVVRVDDVPGMREILAVDGFQLIRGEPHSNFVLGDPHGHEIDVHPVRFDAEGNGVYRMENGEDWIYPASGFAGRGTVAGRVVRCLAPEIQMLNHAGGYVPDEDDFQDMRLLNARFGTPLLPPYDRPYEASLSRAEPP